MLYALATALVLPCQSSYTCVYNMGINECTNGDYTNVAALGKPSCYQNDQCLAVESGSVLSTLRNKQAKFQCSSTEITVGNYGSDTACSNADQISTYTKGTTPGFVKDNVYCVDMVALYKCSDLDLSLIHSTTTTTTSTTSGTTTTSSSSSGSSTIAVPYVCQFNLEASADCQNGLLSLGTGSEPIIKGSKAGSVSCAAWGQCWALIDPDLGSGTNYYKVECKGRNCRNGLEFTKYSDSGCVNPAGSTKTLTNVGCSATNKIGYMAQPSKLTVDGYDSAGRRVAPTAAMLAMALLLMMMTF
jgi:hypothetical protein